MFLEVNAACIANASSSAGMAATMALLLVYTVTTRERAAEGVCPQISIRALSRARRSMPSVWSTTTYHKLPYTSPIMAGSKSIFVMVATVTYCHPQEDTRKYPDMALYLAVSIHQRTVQRVVTSIRTKPANGLKILVVEDDPYTREAILVALRAAGFLCTSAGSAEKAENIVSKLRPDLVVLDLGLPDGDGIEFLKSLRVRDDLPVVVCTGRSAEHDVIQGLDIGADDYITKPFSPGELVLRIRNILKRTIPKSPQAAIFVGDLKVDTQARTVTKGKINIKLTACEFDLLFFLASNPGVVYTREQLLLHVWRANSQKGKVATVTEHVRRLRKKLGDDPSDPMYVKVVRGIGYRVDL